MKALFIKYYGCLSMEMMLGALLDMGVPAAFLKEELNRSGLPVSFTESENHKTRIPAHYFHLSSAGEDRPLGNEELKSFWQNLTAKAHPEWEKPGEKVIQAILEGAEAIQGKSGDPDGTAFLGISKTSLAALYLFLASLDYLEVESIFTCPFSLEEGATRRGKFVKFLLRDAISTAGLALKPEGLSPLAAAVIHSLSSGFVPIDGRFLLGKTAYGTSDPQRPDGNNTMALYLGYFQDRGDSIFAQDVKIFGVGIGREDEI